MKNNRKLWIGGILALILVVVLVVWKTGANNKAASAMEEVKVTRGDLAQKVLANGVVQPQNRLEIKPPIPGRIESILVREGDSIEKGEILAWLSSTERATLLDAASAKGPKEVAYWEDLFKPTPLIAPLSGLLIVRNVEPGQGVTAADPAFVMSDHLIVRVQVDETDIARVQKGQHSAIRLEAYPQEKISGQVDRISFESKVVNNVTIYEVDVLPDKVPDFMWSGMSAEVEFLVTKRENVLLVPAQAVKKDGKQTTVTVHSGRSVLQKEIVVGISDGKQTEIVEGLQEGDTVLMAGYRKPTGKAPAPVNPLSPMPHGRTR